MANRKIFNIDFTRLATWFVPDMLLSGKVLSTVKSMVVPLQALHASFTAYRADAAFRLDTNGQICKLRGALNDRFDGQLRRITISNTHGAKTVYCYMAYENIPQYLPLYLGDGSVHFIVNVPSSLIYLDADFRLLIDTFKRPTKTYEIRYV